MNYKGNYTYNASWSIPYGLNGIFEVQYIYGDEVLHGDNIMVDTDNPYCILPPVMEGYAGDNITVSPSVLRDTSLLFGYNLSIWWDVSGPYGNMTYNGPYIVIHAKTGDYIVTLHVRDIVGHETVVSAQIHVHSRFDSDGDGMPDSWESAHGLNPGVNDATEDNDEDGLSNLDEYKYGTDPLNPDSDGDGWKDGTEVKMQTSPTDPLDHPYRAEKLQKSSEKSNEVPYYILLAVILMLISIIFLKIFFARSGRTEYDPYTVLGVNKEAGRDDIRKAYRARMKELSMNPHVKDREEFRRIIEERRVKRRRIMEAYRELMRMQK